MFTPLGDTTSVGRAAIHRKRSRYCRLVKQNIDTSYLPLLSSETSPNPRRCALGVSGWLAVLPFSAQAAEVFRFAAACWAFPSESSMRKTAR